MSKLNLDMDQCLSLDVMRMYHERQLPAKDMHDVEKHLLDCELCSEVIDGLDVNELPAIRSIAGKVNGRIAALVGPPAAPSFMKRFGWYFAIPAAILIAWFVWDRLQGNAPAKIAATGPVTAPAPQTGNGPAPSRIGQPVSKEPVREPQGVEKQVITDKKVEEPGKKTGSSPVVTETAVNNSVKPEENVNPAPTQKKEESMPAAIEEKPETKIAPPVEDYASLRIFEVRVISKITAPSGKKSSGSSNGQLGSKSGRSDDAVFMPDEMPEFYGGDMEMKYWLARNFNNPVKDKRELKGKTTSVIFNVSSKGKVSDVSIGKSLAPELDAELIRLIESMPQWKPASKKGTIQCMLAITFI